MADEPDAIPDQLFWKTRRAEYDDDLVFLDSANIRINGGTVLVFLQRGV